MVIAVCILIKTLAATATTTTESRVNLIILSFVIAFAKLATGSAGAFCYTLSVLFLLMIINLHVVAAYGELRYWAGLDWAGLRWGGVGYGLGGGVTVSWF